jgi:cell wall-associated NlpC family hydrolase
MPSSEHIVAGARAYLGVPWRHQGRTRAGLDCAGLIVMVARDLGLSDYDSTAYGRRAQGHAFLSPFRQTMDGVPVPEMRPGDVLLFADAAYPCHCGIVSERHQLPHLIHAFALRRQVVEEPYAGEWPEKVKFCFRFRGIED